MFKFEYANEIETGEEEEEREKQKRKKKKRLGVLFFTHWGEICSLFSAFFFFFLFSIHLCAKTVRGGGERNHVNNNREVDAMKALEKEERKKKSTHIDLLCFCFGCAEKKKSG